MPNKIVVLGGSFNPPTKAHLLLAQNAVKELDAKCIFVPSSDAYVRRKMNKQKEQSLVFSEQERYDMLNLLIGNSKDLLVSTVEFCDDGRCHTYDTLVKIQNRYPDSEVWFIIGDDKLNILPKWHNNDRLLNKFHFLVTTRNCESIESAKQKYSVLQQHCDCFAFMNVPDIASISSTQCRNIIRNENWNKLADYTSPAMCEYIKILYTKENTQERNDEHEY